jgi:hypothetical protein
MFSTPPADLADVVDEDREARLSRHLGVAAIVPTHVPVC